jgi:hypothetical protein
MLIRRLSIFSRPVLLFFYLSLNAQTKNPLPRSTPESEGVSSSGIQQFLNAAGNSKSEFHSFMFLRHGKVIAEGWWNPYASNLKHSMYSTSKSFTATAIGFAVNEKRLTLNDKVISFFPKDLPDTISRNLSQLTVKDVLSMSVGQDPDPTFDVTTKDSNWIRSFLAKPILHQPGSQFLYNTLGTFMLSAIIQKVTGEKLIDYLRPRLFDPLGITDMDWELSPKGINTGGWGLRIKTEDMAKFGQLFLQKGQWAGKQLLPAQWVEEATSLKIIQHPGLPQAKKDSSDWEQGYCYQMWRCRNRAFRADGAYGQFIIIIPDEDAVVAITAETADMQKELNLVWAYLLPALHPSTVPANKEDLDKMKQHLASLAIPLVKPLAFPEAEKNISGKHFAIETNQKRIKTISFDFDNEKCYLTLNIDSISYRLAFGLGQWEIGETTKRGPNLISNSTFNFYTFGHSKVAGAYRWIDNNTIELTLRYIESPHSEKTVCHFDRNLISVDIQNSLDFGNKTTVLKGVRQE